MPQKRPPVVPAHYQAFLQMVAYRSMQNVANELLATRDLNMTQWVMLGRLCDNHDGLRVSDLARLLHVEVPLMTMMVQPLLRSGYVMRKRDEYDRRAWRLYLTATGNKLVQFVDEQVTKRLRERGALLPPAQLARYAGLLETLIAHEIERGTPRGGI